MQITIDGVETELSPIEYLPDPSGGGTLNLRVTSLSGDLPQLLEKPHLLENLVIPVQFEQRIFQATLGIVRQVFPLTDSSGPNVSVKVNRFSLEEETADFYEFLIPDIDLGEEDEGTYFGPPTEPPGRNGYHRDHIHFSVEGLHFTLRKTFQTDGELLSLDQLSGRPPEGYTETTFALLQVSCPTFARAAEVTDNVLWLLHLAYGQKVVWTRAYRRDGATRMLFQSRSANLPASGKGFTPISNSADNAIQRFVESGYPIFLSDLHWWKITVDWLVLTFETRSIDQRGVLFSILLDRIANKVLKDVVFPAQVHPDLDVILGTDDELVKAEFQQQLHAHMAELIPGWPEGKTGSLIASIRNLNGVPYKTRIEKAFEDLNVLPPSKKILDARNALVHNGKLKVKGGDLIGYLSEITTCVLAAMFSMLHYEGPFYSLGRRLVDCHHTAE